MFAKITMVHLNSVENDSQLDAPLVKGLEKIKIESPGEDEVSQTVYGSRYAAEGLPSGSMPDREM